MLVSRDSNNVLHVFEVALKVCGSEDLFVVSPKDPVALRQIGSPRSLRAPFSFAHLALRK